MFKRSMDPVKIPGGKTSKERRHYIQYLRCSMTLLSDRIGQRTGKTSQDNKQVQAFKRPGKWSY